MKQASLLINLIKTGIYAIFLSPLVVGFSFFFPFVAPKAFFIMLICEIIFFAWLALISTEKSFRPSKNLLLLFVFLFILSLILSTIFSLSPSISFWSNSERMTGLLFFLHLFAFFLVFSSTLSKKEIEDIFFFLVLIGILITLSIFIFPTGRNGGTLGNESFWGTSLLFIIFWAVYLVFQFKGFRRNFLIFSIVFLTLILSFSPARAAKVSVLLGLILLFLFYYSSFSRSNLSKFGARFLLILFFLFGIVTFISLFNPNSFIRHLLTRFTDPSFGGRFIVWNAAWHGFLERPILGWGLENFDIIFVKYFNPCVFGPSCGGEIWYDRAHNVIFDLLTSAGLLGTFTFLLIFLCALYLLYQKYRKTREKNDLLNFFIFFCLFFAYFLQGMTVFDMPVSYLFLFTTFGFLSVLTQLEREKKAREEKISPLFSSISIFLLIICFYYFIFLPVQVNKAILKCLSLQKNEALSYCQMILRSPFGRFHNFENLATFLSPDPNSDAFISLTTKKKLEFVAQQLEKNLQSFPQKFRTHYFLVRTYRILASYDLRYSKIAEEKIDKLINLYPNHQLVYVEKILFLISENKIEEAKKYLEKARQLEPNSRYVMYISQQLEKLEKIENH